MKGCMLDMYVAPNPSYKEDEIIIRLPQQLRKLRFTVGMNQEQTALALSINRSTYAYYETGRTRPPLESLVKIARYYHVSLEYLLGVEHIVRATDKLCSVRFL